MSSILIANNRASRNASGSDGSYFPVSIAFTDWRDTSSRSASSACDHPRSARNTRNRLFTGRPVLPEDQQFRSSRDEDENGRDRQNRHLRNRSVPTHLNEAPNRGETHRDHRRPEKRTSQQYPLELVAHAQQEQTATDHLREEESPRQPGQNRTKHPIRIPRSELKTAQEKNQGHADGDPAATSGSAFTDHDVFLPELPCNPPQCGPESSLRGQRIGKLVGKLRHKHREAEREQLHERLGLPMPAEDPQKSRENIDGKTSPCPCQQAAHRQVALEVVAFSLQIPPREKENRDQGKVFEG